MKTMLVYILRISFLFVLFTTLCAQNTQKYFFPQVDVEAKELDSVEWKNIFFPDIKERKDVSIYKERNLSHFLYVLFYKDKPIFSDPFPKNGNLNSSIGRKVKFCFLESILTKEELRKIELSEKVSFKYDIHNPEFFCSVNFKLFTYNDDGTVEMNDPFYPFLTSKIFEVNFLAEKNESIYQVPNITPSNAEYNLNKEDAEVINNDGIEEITIPLEEDSNKPSWPLKPE